MFFFGTLALLFLGSTAFAQLSCSTITTTSVSWKIESQTALDINRSLLRYHTVNSRWPAPAITVPQCTKLVLTVDNQCDEYVTLHFHGILQSGGQTIQDGAQGLSQSGIPPGKNFTYNVLLDKEGTYWVHSHSAGQYPKGIRAPLIVTRSQDTIEYDYGADQTVTLSDWWPIFEKAHDRSLSTSSDSNTGTCGDPTNPNGYGIELPANRVLFNDVFGYSNDTLQDANRVVSLGDCAARKRIRFVNMSSHARFYIWFADKRSFEVIELDGVSYKSKSTNYVEVSSGQRVSIIVGAKSPAGACSGTYIIAASDPKVAHGTNRCPMWFTRPDRGVQFTHGYLEVNGQSANPVRKTVLDGPEAPLDLLKVWSASTVSDGNFQYYPSKSWDATADKLLQNRMQLPYQILYYNENDINDYGSPGGSRSISGVFGIGGAEELQMAPKAVEAAWDVPSGDYKTRIHYVTLGIENSADNNGHGGFAAMAENLNVNKLLPWTSPDAQPSGNVDRTKVPQFPSVLRALDNTTSDADLNLSGHYKSSIDTTAGGRTIMFPDSTPQWLVLRSSIGDHPMHLHGHHFQVLAKLPPKWYDQESSQLYNLLTLSTSNTAGKADRSNPPKRDTLMIEKGLTYVIAVKPDNPGVWALHCHNDIHAMSGMFAQVIERPADLRRAMDSWKAVAGSTSGTDIDFSWGAGTGTSAALGDLGLPTAIAARVKQSVLTAMGAYGWDINRVGWK